MTRINVVPVEELTNMHLLGEYKEITRLPNYLKRSLNRKKPFSFDEIPSRYTLGKGHVKFFYNKMMWLQTRYVELADEMERRGMSPKRLHEHLFLSVPKKFYNDYKPDKAAMEINRERILDRLNAKEV